MSHVRSNICLLLARVKSENIIVYHICLHILSIFEDDEEISDMISPKHIITPAIEVNVIDIKHVGELDIHTSRRGKCPPLVMADCHCGPFLERMRVSPLLETARKHLDHFTSCARRRSEQRHKKITEDEYFLTN